MTEDMKRTYAHPESKLNALLRGEICQVEGGFLQRRRQKMPRRQSRTQGILCGTWRDWRKRGAYATPLVLPMGPYTVGADWTSAKQ
jgi:hypothetical protein